MHEPPRREETSSFKTNATSHLPTWLGGVDGENRPGFSMLPEAQADFCIYFTAPGFSVLRHFYWNSVHFKYSQKSCADYPKKTMFSTLLESSDLAHKLKIIFFLNIAHKLYFVPWRGFFFLKKKNIFSNLMIFIFDLYINNLLYL